MRVAAGPILAQHRSEATTSFHFFLGNLHWSLGNLPWSLLQEACRAPDSVRTGHTFQKPQMLTIPDLWNSVHSQTLCSMHEYLCSSHWAVVSLCASPASSRHHSSMTSVFVVFFFKKAVDIVDFRAPAVVVGCSRTFHGASGAVEEPSASSSARGAHTMGGRLGGMDERVSS